MIRGLSRSAYSVQMEAIFSSVIWLFIVDSHYIVYLAYKIGALNFTRHAGSRNLPALAIEIDRSPVVSCVSKYELAQWVIVSGR